MKASQTVDLNHSERDYLQYFLAALCKSERLPRLKADIEAPLQSSEVAKVVRAKLESMGLIQFPTESKLGSFESLHRILPGPNLQSYVESEVSKSHSPLLSILNAQERELLGTLFAAEALERHTLEVIQNMIKTKIGEPLNLLAIRLSVSEENLAAYIGNNLEALEIHDGRVRKKTSLTENDLEALQVPKAFPAPRPKPQKSLPMDERTFRTSCELLSGILKAASDGDRKEGINHIKYKRLRDQHTQLPPFQDLKLMLSSNQHGLKLGSNHKIQTVILLDPTQP